MLVTMATPISSYVKDKNSIFTARDHYDFLVKGKILVFHQYLYNTDNSVRVVMEAKWGERSDRVFEPTLLVI